MAAAAAASRAKTNKKLKCGVPANKYTDPHARTHTCTYHSTHSTHTHMLYFGIHTRIVSGPHKVDVGLLLYTVAATNWRAFTAV